MPETQFKRRLLTTFRLLAVIVTVSAILSTPASAGVGWWPHVPESNQTSSRVSIRNYQNTDSGVSVGWLFEASLAFSWLF